jgi:oligopeptide transport system substrate-binding protein
MNEESRLPTPPNASTPAKKVGPFSKGRFRLLISASVIVLIVSLAGVLITRSVLNPSRATSPVSTKSEPPRASADKQVLRILGLGPNAGDLDAIDPALITYSGSYEAAQLIFPELITLDEAGAPPVDWAAQSHEVSADGLTYTFHLRSRMTWSDGAPIDANTFAYSINRALDPCLSSSVAYYLYNIKGATDFNDAKNCTAGSDGLTTTGTLIGKSIVVADLLTLKLILGAPAAYFLGALSYPTSWAVPKQLIDRYGQAKWTDHLGDGAGFGGNLYKVAKWDHTGHFAVTANSSFWGQKPVIQRIDWTLYQSEDTAWADYQVGLGDVGFPPAHDLTQARPLPGYHETPQLSVYFLRVNWALAPFDDVRVRNAFSLAIDRKAITTSIDKGGAAPTIHMIIQGLPGYNPDLKNAAGDSGDKTNVANVAKARELAKAYATEMCDGDFSKCTPVVLTYPTISSTIYLQAQAFQQEWQTTFPGWQITAQGLDLSVMLKSASTLQLAFGAWLADYPDPQDFLSVQWAKDAQFNESSVDVPAADALERQADVSNDAAGRLTQYDQAEQMLVDQGAFISIEQPLRAYVVRPAAKLVKWRINALSVTGLSTWQQAYIAV